MPTEFYEAVNNSTANLLSISCLNWGVQPNYGAALYGLCPVTSATNDNGTLQSATFKAGGPGYPQFLVMNQSFNYDKLNRLTSASDSGGWSRTFNYDQTGNLWVTNPVGGPWSGSTPTTNAFTNNRINGASYDLSGNQLVVNGDTLAYDAENRQSAATDNTTHVTQKYLYDGAGQRVEETIVGGATTVYVYDIFGLAAEYSTGSNAMTCTTCYPAWDHLGSTRLLMDQNANVIARHDYLPFGEEILANTAGRNSQWGPLNDTVAQKFTGQTRDSETGVDYFNARYFGAALGRFTSPDPANAGADIMNPQSWNAYAYVLGNPLNAVDPTGACDVALYGITMNPGESSLVSNFSANKIAVFPYEGTNLATGLRQVIGGGGDVNSAILGIRSAIAQTPAGQSVNIFTFSGGTQTLVSAWGSLTSAEQSRIGNITYSIPGSFTGAFSFSGALPRGSTNPMMVFPNGNYEIPSGAPSVPYDTTWATSCGHDVNCILKTEGTLLQQRSGSSCSTPQTFPAAQKQLPVNGGSKRRRSLGGGSAASRITYGPTLRGWEIFDLLRLLFPPTPRPPNEM